MRWDVIIVEGGGGSDGSRDSDGIYAFKRDDECEGNVRIMQ